MPHVNIWGIGGRGSPIHKNDSDGFPPENVVLNLIFIHVLSCRH